MTTEIRDNRKALSRRRVGRLAGLLALAAAASVVFGGCASTSSLPESASARRDTAPEAIDSEQASELRPAVESAEDARGRAAAALAENDVDLALYFYLEAVKLDPQDADSFYRIAAINERKGNTNVAARAYAEAVRIEPDNALALQGLGVAYFEARDMDGAQATLERAVAADAGLWRAHNVLGVIADAHGDYERAAEHYSAALEVNPDAASILNNRGYSKYLAADLDGAEADFKAAIAADNRYERAWHNLGLLYARQRKYGFAMRALSNVTSDYVAANDVGYVAMLDGDYDSAEVLFAEAMRLSPRYYPTAQANLEELKRRRNGTAVEGGDASAGAR